MGHNGQVVNRYSMGRGLSPEQRKILAVAAGAPQPGTPPGVDLLIRDAIEACYPDLRYWRDSKGKPPCVGRDCWREQTPELKRAKAAVSRAVKRLEERGLLERKVATYSRWAGLTLTEEGRRQAKLLSWEQEIDAGFGAAWRSTSERAEQRAAIQSELKAQGAAGD